LKFTLTQSRISFCGPLIAFGAAQQAAKNNGINIYESTEQGDYKTVYSDLINYLTKLDPSSEYYNYGDIPQYLNYYQWRGPYVSMLQLITSQGLAVRPSGRFPGIESIDPPWLDDESLYRAILNSMWCNPNLNAIVKYPDSYWNGRWWNVDFDHTSFPEESEIYTLGISFTGSVRQSALQMALDRTLSATERERLAPIAWCTYDSKWSRYSANGIEDNLNYSGPNNDGYNYWSRGMFLRADLKGSTLYGGATAYAECYQHIKLMNKYKTRMTRPTNSGYIADENEHMAKAKSALRNNIIRETPEKSLKVGNDSATDNDRAGAVAKPIGALPNGEPPTEAVIVLPVFNNAALIPSSMQRCRPLRVSFSDLEKFLIWLSEITNLHNPPSAPPDGTQHYLTALQRLDDQTFRKSGWNNDYVRDDTDISIYFEDDYKYNPETNPTGAGWLQQIWRARDISRDEEENLSQKLEEEAAGWNTRIYKGRYYILRDRNGRLVTNEQMECRWEPGGPGPGPAPGTRIGPPHL
jgi:hypothetical protein